MQRESTLKTFLFLVVWTKSDFSDNFYIFGGVHLMVSGLQYEHWTFRSYVLSYEEVRYLYFKLYLIAVC
jgi:hypothetical protein